MLALLATAAVAFNAVYVDCNGDPIPANVSTYCQANGAPATLCRFADPNCTATGERVAEHLHISSDEHTNCTTFNWTWSCSELTDAPTAAPTTAPTAAPTTVPTAAPTTAPTAAPTSTPTTPFPTATPTTAAPTAAPTTTAPTAAVGDDGGKDGVGRAPWWAWVILTFGILLIGTAMCHYSMPRGDAALLRHARVHPNPVYEPPPHRV